MNVEDALVRLDWSVRRVMEQIERNKQAIAVVVDDNGRFLATVTDGDIRRAILNGMDLDLPVQALTNQGARTVDRDPLTVPQGTAESTLLKLMSDFSIRHVPIVDAAGRVIDIALLSDLIKEPYLPIDAVVMAGGLGSRLRPLTEELPKPMLPVGERPLLESTIQQLCEAGIRRVNLITHYKKEIIADHFGDGQGFGVDIRYVEEDQPLGTAGGLGLLEESDKPLLVINGDIITKVDFRAMLDFHYEQQADMTVAVRSQELRLSYGVVETDGAVITGITEKPVLRHFINAGIYLLNPQLCRYIPAGQRYDMPDLIQLVLSEDKRVVSFPVHEYWLDIGQADDYQRAKEDSARGTS